MKILPIVVLVACVVCQAAARAQDEERPAPSRGLLKRGLLAKGKQTTTTTTQAPHEEVEYEDDADYAGEEGAQEPSTEAPPSSTEGKKLVAGGIRPFRSNTDLLEALKRRRAQAAEAKLHGHTSTTSAPAQDSATEAPVKANYNNKKRFNSGSRDEEVAAPSKTSRVRYNRPSSRSVAEPEPEENDAAPPARAGRTFSRRGGN